MAEDEMSEPDVDAEPEPVSRRDWIIAALFFGLLIFVAIATFIIVTHPPPSIPPRGPFPPFLGH